MAWVGWTKQKVGLSLNEKWSAVDGVMVSLSLLIDILRLYRFERMTDGVGSIVGAVGE